MQLQLLLDYESVLDYAMIIAIYTAPYVLLLMRANPLRGQVGEGLALKIETLLGQRRRVVKRVPFGAQKVDISRAQPPPPCPSNRFDCITYQAVSIRGLKIVLSGYRTRIRDPVPFLTPGSGIQNRFFSGSRIPNL